MQVNFLGRSALQVTTSTSCGRGVAARGDVVNYTPVKWPLYKALKCERHHPKLWPRGQIANAAMVLSNIYRLPVLTTSAKKTLLKNILKILEADRGKVRQRTRNRKGGRGI